jgi:hypothetical protein
MVGQQKQTTDMGSNGVKFVSDVTKNIKEVI